MRDFKSTQIPHPPFCLAWNLIPKDKKLALEIGAGTGRFSIEFAKWNKDWFLIALERTQAKSNRFKGLSAADRELRENLCFLRADGVNVVTHLFKEKSLDQIFLLYPNPYPKAKQANLRWHNMPFFTELLAKLKASGEIELRTNLNWYANEFEDRMINTFHLKLKSKEVLESDFKPQTAFERKYLLRNESCYRLLFTF